MTPVENMLCLWVLGVVYVIYLHTRMVENKRLDRISRDLSRRVSSLTRQCHVMRSALVWISEGAPFGFSDHQWASVTAVRALKEVREIEEGT